MKTVIVNVENLARAETAAQFDRMLPLTSGINQWFHFRMPTPLDKQTVIRMKRSFASKRKLDSNQAGGRLFRLPAALWTAGVVV